jgi:hypothetical protein
MTTFLATNCSAQVPRMPDSLLRRPVDAGKAGHADISIADYGSDDSGWLSFGLGGGW